MRLSDDFQSQEEAIAYVLKQRRVINEMRQDADKLQDKANHLIDEINVVKTNWELKDNDYETIG